MAAYEGSTSSNLYEDINRNGEPEIREDQLETASAITRSELESVIRVAKRRKAVGADGIPVDVLKEAGGKTESTLLSILNEIYRSGNLPVDFYT